MLIDYELSQIQTVEHLIKIWTARYVPNVSTLTVDNNQAIHDRLSLADRLNLTASKEGRINTANKLHKHLIEHQCSLAAVRARELYSYYEPSSFKEQRIWLNLLAVFI